MGLSYFENKKWCNITREERLFCAIAYNYFSKAPKDTVSWMNDQCELGLENEKLNADWEIGYEVALYRDYIHCFGGEFEENRFKKRTFDLCCFSEELIIIIEAKSFGSFLTKQLDDFNKDRVAVPKKIRHKELKTVEVKVVPLISSNYNPNTDTLKNFDCNKPLTWEALYKKFNDDLFKRANMTYGLKKSWGRKDGNKKNSNITKY